jgi:hypothetical protein
MKLMPLTRPARLKEAFVSTSCNSAVILDASVTPHDMLATVLAAPRGDVIPVSSEHDVEEALRGATVELRLQGRSSSNFGDVDSETFCSAPGFSAADAADIAASDLRTISAAAHASRDDATEAGASTTDGMHLSGPLNFAKGLGSFAAPLLSKRKPYSNDLSTDLISTRGLNGGVTSEMLRNFECPTGTILPLAKRQGEKSWQPLAAVADYTCTMKSDKSLMECRRVQEQMEHAVAAAGVAREIPLGSVLVTRHHSHTVYHLAGNAENLTHLRCALHEAIWLATQRGTKFLFVPAVVWKTDYGQPHEHSLRDAARGAASLAMQETFSNSGHSKIELFEEYFDSSTAWAEKRDLLGFSIPSHPTNNAELGSMDSNVDIFGPGNQLGIEKAMSLNNGVLGLTTQEERKNFERGVEFTVDAICSGLVAAQKVAKFKGEKVPKVIVVVDISCSSGTKEGSEEEMRACPRAAEVQRRDEMKRRVEWTSKHISAALRNKFSQMIDGRHYSQAKKTY